MINKDFLIEKLKHILNNDFFIVEIKINEATDRIQIFLDRFSKGISLNDCEYIHKKLYPFLEEKLDNFELEISSPGLTTPFKVWQQYYKNIGKKIKLFTLDNKEIQAKILDADNQQVKLLILKNNKELILPYENIKKAILIIF